MSNVYATAKTPRNEAEACQMMARYVTKLASKWARNHRADFDDLYSEGMIGVLRAYQKFNAAKGAAFTTYAYQWASACISSTAKKNWTVYNNMASGDISERGDTIEDLAGGTSVDSISLRAALEKLPKNDQALFAMKLAGYTFQEISEELGFDSLHKARNRYLEIQDQVAI